MYVGGGYVAHAPKGGTIRLDPLPVFTGEQVPELVSRVPFYDQDAAVERALRLIGKPYDVLPANCEHLVNYAQTGVAFSQTVRAIGTLAFLGGLIWVGGRA